MIIMKIVPIIFFYFDLTGCIYVIIVISQLIHWFTNTLKANKIINQVNTTKIQLVQSFMFRWAWNPNIKADNQTTAMGLMSLMRLCTTVRAGILHPGVWLLRTDASRGEHVSHRPKWHLRIHTRIITFLYTQLDKLFVGFLFSCCSPQIAELTYKMRSKVIKLQMEKSLMTASVIDEWQVSDKLM